MGGAGDEVAFSADLAASADAPRVTVTADVRGGNVGTSDDFASVGSVCFGAFVEPKVNNPVLDGAAFPKMETGAGAGS